MKIKRSTGEVIFDIFNVIFMIIIILVTLYPLWYVLVSSLSDPQMVAEGKTMLWFANPNGQFLNFAAYKEAFEYKNGLLLTSYANTIYYSVAGTVVSMILSILGAYSLSKKRLKGRLFFTMIMVISMWFSAGMIPTYLNFVNLGLEDTATGVIVGFALSAFNVILVRTYFESISDSLEESAKMDGANDITILFKIYIPLSVPAIMTVSLYYFVGKWNAYIWSQILFKTDAKMPMQVLIKKLVVDRQASSESVSNVDSSTLGGTSSETVIYATIMLATLPMVILYPFVQKFFVKGIMVGSVKG